MLKESVVVASRSTVKRPLSLAGCGDERIVDRGQQYSNIRSDSDAENVLTKTMGVILNILSVALPQGRFDGLKFSVSADYYSIVLSTGGRW